MRIKNKPTSPVGEKDEAGRFIGLSSTDAGFNVRFIGFIFCYNKDRAQREANELPFGLRFHYLAGNIQMVKILAFDDQVLICGIERVQHNRVAALQIFF